MKWISVKDRLPDVNAVKISELVLLFDELNSDHTFSWRSGYYDNGSNSFVVVGNFDFKATHWQPLPEPPEDI